MSRQNPQLPSFPGPATAGGGRGAARRASLRVVARLRDKEDLGLLGALRLVLVVDLDASY